MEFIAHLILFLLFLLLFSIFKHDLYHCLYPVLFTDSYIPFNQQNKKINEQFINSPQPNGIVAKEVAVV